MLLRQNTSFEEISSAYPALYITPELCDVMMMLRRCETGIIINYPECETINT